MHMVLYKCTADAECLTANKSFLKFQNCVMAATSSNAIKLMECPVCLDYLQPPIFLCQNGHSVCTNCKSKLTACPTCRAIMCNTRCIVLEHIIKKIKFPCTNTASGCSKLIYLKTAKEHEILCAHGLQDCPYNKLLGLANGMTSKPVAYSP